MTCAVCNGSGKVVAKYDSATEHAVLGQCPVCVKKTMEINAMSAEQKKIEELEAQLAALKGTAGDSALKTVGGQVANAFMEAGKAKVAAEANAKLIGMVKGALGDKIPQDSSLVDALLAIGTPVLLLYGTNAIAGVDHPAVPKGLVSGLEKTAGYALQGVSQQAVNTAIEQGLPMLMQVAQLGAGLEAKELGAGQPETYEATVEEE